MLTVATSWKKGHDRPVQGAESVSIVLQVTIENNKTLGELAGLYKLNSDGEATRVVGCSAALVTDFGEDTEALKVLKSNIASRKAQE